MPTVPFNTLRAASVHIAYEVEQMLYCSHQMERADALVEPLSQADYNVYLTAFVSHARCLKEFLFKTTKREPTDMLAVDYLPKNVSLDQLDPELEERLAAVWKLASVTVAHLSYCRDVAERKWDFHRIQDDLLEVLGQFVALVPRECLHSDLQKYRRTAA